MQNMKDLQALLVIRHMKLGWSLKAHYPWAYMMLLSLMWSTTLHIILNWMSLAEAKLILLTEVLAGE